MSFLSSRPESPPPRSPSPDVVLAPLPAPPVRRRTHSARPPRLSLTASADPKAERSMHLQKTLASMRSCGDLRQNPPTKSAPRSVLSAPPTPRSFAPSSPSSPGFRRTHRRTLSFAVPYRSPPASPTLSSPPPPVPPIPEFVLSPTDKKPVLHSPAPTRVDHIYLPEWEQFTVAPDVTPRKPRTSMSGRRTGGGGAPMTCSTFFALHNPNQRPNQVVAP
ncbi:hypothetical protein B0H17DRAFT_1073366 [Mycena rosella]|uniref:Uncharacterized protein n=1 Tax=Mycena rosella TaxID=1033263 RepID=A0AAD7D976_MYCRO|nr:hypothetical protein B0H17DRAFT_1073366 [Mycena rosella]